MSEAAVIAKIIFVMIGTHWLAMKAGWQGYTEGVRIWRLGGWTTDTLHARTSKPR